MNFGEKLKQIRAGRNQTQPEFAAAIGIEQSYLSKLENDKSQPSAEMFAAIVKSLDMTPTAFLADLDRATLDGPLRHIPEVSQFLHGQASQRLHHARRYIWSAALAGALGFALMLASNDGIFYPNNLYKYVSKGVLQPGESDQALDSAPPQRLNLQTVELWGHHGTVFFQNDGSGRRKFELNAVQYIHPPANRVLQYIGAVLAFCGVLLVVVESRLRRAAALPAPRRGATA